MTLRISRWTLVLIGLMATLLAGAMVARYGETVLQGVLVVIDPGHGGRDLGTMNNGIWEHDYVYDVACRLKRLLERYEIASNSKLSAMLLSRIDQEVAIQIEPGRICSWDFSERMKGAIG